MSRDGRRLLTEFVAEAQGILEEATGTLETLESAGPDAPPELVNAFFRSVHSLKGLASMVGLARLAEAAHDVETLLDGVRMGRVPLDHETVGVLVDAFAQLSELVARVVAGEKDPAAPDGLRSALAAAQEPRAHGPKAAAEVVLPKDLEGLLTDYERHRVQENVRKGRRVLVLPLELPFETFDDGLRAGMAEAAQLGELIGTFPGASSDPERMAFQLLVGAPPEVDLQEAARRCGAARCVVVEPETAPPAATRVPHPPAEGAGAAPPELFAGTVRVPLEKISTLLDLAGEAAVSSRALRGVLEMALLRTADRGVRFEVLRACSEVERAVSAFGRAALATRLVPLDPIGLRLARTARSIASALGKEIDFSIVGGDTEVDKVLADRLSDPLLHLVRNAVDHGIEAPDERQAMGKPRAGTIRLEAAARGRDVVVRLSDDGRGVDRSAIVARARQKGLLGADEPDPSDPLALVFRAGFSTASTVSELSGRGVGLDVVRTNILAAKGSVSVRSEPGRGTQFEIVVPLTLALVESVLVRAGGRYFAFPASSVVRTFDAPPERSAPGAGLPLVPLDRLLGLPEEESAEGGAVVVAEEGSRRVGFLVSEIEGMLDVVVKPLGAAVPRALEITGTAELPDGDIAFTLDTGRLLDRLDEPGWGGTWPRPS